MSRIKSSTVIPLSSKVAFENCVDEIAKLKLEIDADVAAHNEAQAAAEDTFKVELKTKKDRLAQKILIAQMYSDHNREELLGDKQSAETLHALFGYRKSPGILKPLNSKWTLARAMQALIDAGKTACVKVTSSLDKQAVKREIPEDDLPQYGLRMDYPEEFWIEAKRAEQATDKRLTA